MKRFALAITLACVLSGAALAGEIPSTGAPAPTSTSTSSGKAQGPGITAAIVLTIVGLISR